MRIMQKRYIKWVVGLAIIFPLILLFQTTSSTELAKAVGKHKVSETAFSNNLKADGAENKKELSHEQIVSLTEGFMDTLVQEIDNQNRVVNYNSKRDLLEAFTQVATKDVASQFVDFYFVERANGLYIKPTETPPWFQPKNDYQTVNEGKNTVTVKQQNESDLYGFYNIEIEFSLSGNQWKITEITY